MAPQILPHQPTPSPATRAFQQRSAVVSRFGGAITLIILSACNAPSAALPPEPTATHAFGDVLVDHSEVLLEENSVALTVFPQVRPDAPTGFLVADMQEAQVRLYTSEGRLLEVFGRKGHGPGEFTLPTSAHRLGDRSILVADYSGRLTQLDSLAQAVVNTYDTGIQPLYGAVPFGPGTVILLGPDRRPAPYTRVVHHWSLLRDTITWSAVSLPGRTPFAQSVARSVGWVSASVHADTTAVALALVDSLYLLDATGNLLKTIPVPLTPFVTVDAAAPPSRSDPTARDKFLSQLSRLESIFWLPDGRFLIQYTRQSRNDTRWGQVLLGPRGQPHFHLYGGPRLIAVQTPHLFFVSPRTNLPNLWAVTTLR